MAISSIRQRVSPYGSFQGHEDTERIMHVSLPISKETVMMGSDRGGEWPSSYSQGNNFSIFINTDTKSEADRLFYGPSSENRFTVPLNKTFWGTILDCFTDKFGIN